MSSINVKKTPLPPNCRKFFLGGLHYNTAEIDLKQYFQEYDEIKSVVVSRKPNGDSKGFGFINFKTREG